MSHDPEVGFQPVLTASHGVLEVEVGLLGVIGVKQSIPGVQRTAKAPHLKTKHFFQLRCPVIAPCDQIGIEQPDVACLLRQGQALASNAQFLLGQLAFSDVLGQPYRAFACDVRRIHGASQKMAPESASVLAGEKLLDTVGFSPFQAFENYGQALAPFLFRIPEGLVIGHMFQFSCAVPEHGFHGAVAAMHPASTHHADAGAGRIENRVDLCMGFAQSHLGCLAIEHFLVEPTVRKQDKCDKAQQDSSQRQQPPHDCGPVYPFVPEAGLKQVVFHQGHQPSGAPVVVQLGIDSFAVRQKIFQRPRQIRGRSADTPTDLDRRTHGKKDGHVRHLTARPSERTFGADDGEIGLLFGHQTHAVTGGRIPDNYRIGGVPPLIGSQQPVLILGALLYGGRAACQILRALQNCALRGVGEHDIAHVVVGDEAHLRFAPVDDMQVVGKHVATPIGEQLGLVVLLLDGDARIVMELLIEAVQAPDFRTHTEVAGKRLAIGLIEVCRGTGDADTQTVGDVNVVKASRLGRRRQASSCDNKGSKKSMPQRRETKDMSPRLDQT